MKKLKLIILLSVIFVLSLFLFKPHKTIQKKIKNFSFSQTQPIELPEIGPYMLQTNGKTANWLGVPLSGKELLEPINIIIIDNIAKSEQEAIKNLEKAMNDAGFPARFGHSANYQGAIDGNNYQQLPKGKYLAYSDDHFEFDNDHGRIFGPHFFNNKYYFIGAFSREDIALRAGIGHSFDSFNKARDQMAKNIDDASDYNIIEFIHLKNYVINHPKQTTGDHDGISIVLSN